MGAGKSRALGRSRAGCDDRGRPADRGARRHGRSQAFDATARRLPRPRGRGGRRAARAADGGAIALGGGSVLSERIRDALARQSSSGSRSTPRRPGGGSRDRPLAPGAEDVERAVRRRAGRSTKSSPTRSCRRATARIGGTGDAGDSGAGRAARRDEAALGGERVRRVPGARRARPPRLGLVAAGGTAVLIGDTVSLRFYADRLEPFALGIEATSRGGRRRSGPGGADAAKSWPEPE